MKETDRTHRMLYLARRIDELKEEARRLRDRANDKETEAENYDAELARLEAANADT